MKANSARHIASGRMNRAPVSALIALQLLQTFMQSAWAAGITPATAGSRLDQAANSVPIVNIAKPGAAGISHNSYSQFDVGTQGVILNNSAQPVNTQLGGYITGNANLGAGAARLILNEVIAANPSQLAGYMEVAGQKAGVVVANPFGISCSGCGFINTSHATLTTGTPVWSQDGKLSGFSVKDGVLRIEGEGLNARNVDGLSLYARALELNADLYARSLDVATGSNLIDADTGAATPLAAATVAPTYSVDSSALGGMYADTIRLVGTEAGIGMRLAGPLAALTGKLEILSNGDVKLARASAADALSIQAEGSLDLSSDTTARGDVLLEAQQAVTLGAGARLTGNDVQLAGETIGTAAGSAIAARGNLSVAAAQQQYAGSVGSAGYLTLTGSEVRNVSALAAATGLMLNAGTFINSGSVDVVSGTASINLSGMFSNVDGDLHHGGDVFTLNAAQLDNRGGVLASQGSVRLALADLAPVINDGGTLQGNHGLSVQADGFSNVGGRMLGNELLDLQLGTGTLDNQGGVVETAGDIVTDSAKLLNAGGQINASSLTLNLHQFDSVESAGSIDAHDALTVHVQTDLHLGGEAFNAGGAITLISDAGSLQIDNRVIAGSDVSLAATAVNIGAGGFVATVGALQVRAQDMTNLGVLYGSSALALQIENQLNNGSASEALVAAQLLSDGNITISRADGDKLLSLNNYGSRIETSNGNIRIKADALLNQSRWSSLDIVSTAETLAPTYGDNCPSRDCSYYDGTALNQVADYTRIQYRRVPAANASAGALSLTPLRTLLATGQAHFDTDHNVVSTAGELLATPAAYVYDGFGSFQNEFLVVCCYQDFSSLNARRLYGDPGFFHGHDLGGNDGAPIFDNIRFSKTSTTVDHNTIALTDWREASIVANGAGEAGKGNITIDAGQLDNLRGRVSASDVLNINAGTINNLAIATNDVAHFATYLQFKEDCGDGCAHRAAGPFRSDSTYASRLDQIIPAILEGRTVSLNADVILNGEAPCDDSTAASPNCQASAQYRNVSEVALPSAPPGAQIQNRGNPNVADPSSLPGFNLPGDGLFHLNADPAYPYLIETDPALATYVGFLGSAYLLAHLDGWTPGITQKRLGDGYYELMLVREALLASIGSRFLDPAIADEETQFQYLMDNAIAAAAPLHLSPGIALTSDQINALQSDIVWMEARHIAGQDVLVPVVYLAQGGPRLLKDGAVIGGGSLSVATGTLSNNGVIQASDSLDVTASQVLANIGGAISASGDLTLRSEGNLLNESGQIIGNNVLMQADGDVINQTWTQVQRTEAGPTTSWHTEVGNTASVQAQGTLTQMAGGDIQLIAVHLSGGEVALNADNILLDAAETREGYRYNSADWQVAEERVRHLQTVVEAAAELNMLARGDINAIAASLQSGGDMTLSAKGHVVLLDAQQSDQVKSHYQGQRAQGDDERRHAAADVNTLRAGGHLTVTSEGDLESVGTRFSGESVTLESTQGTVAMLAAYDTDNESHKRQEKGFLSKAESQSSLLEEKAVVNTVDAGAGGVTVRSQGDQVQEGTIIHSQGGLELSSQEGEVMLAAARDILQSSSLSTSDDGFLVKNETASEHHERVRMVQMEASAAPIIQAAQGLHVQLRENAGASRENVDAVIVALSQEPGLEWLKKAQMRGDIDYDRIREIHDSQHDTTRSLGMVSAIVVAIAVTVATAGAGAGAGAAVMGATTTGVAATTSAAISAATSAMITSAAITGTSAALNSALNGEGLGGAYDRLNNHQTLQGIVTSGLSAGVAAGVGQAFFDVGTPATANKAFNLSHLDGVGQQLAYSLSTNAAGTIVSTAINGGSYRDSLEKAVVQGVADTVGAVGFYQGAGLAEHLDLAEGSLGRALIHAGTGAVVGQIAYGDAAGGAAGAFVTALATPALDTFSAALQGDAEFRQALGEGTGMVGGLLTGHVESAATGKLTGQLEDQYNRQLHMDEAQRLATLKQGKSLEAQARLDAAACALAHCAEGVPESDSNYAVLKALEERGVAYAQEQALLKQGGFFAYTSKDKLNDYLLQNDELITRLAGAASTVGGGFGIVGGMGLATAGCVETLGLGCGLSFTFGTALAAQSYQAGVDGLAASLGPYQSSEGQWVLASFSPQTFPDERDRTNELAVQGGINLLALATGRLGGKLLESVPSKLPVIKLADGVDSNSVKAEAAFYRDFVGPIPEKGFRPDPSTYLSQEYRDAHAALFDDGVVRIQPSAPAGKIGRTETWVLPKSVADDAIAQSQGDVAKLEQLLGFDAGYLGKAPVRVEIPSPTGYRMPTGNEFGANEFWRPGGFTWPGSLPEAIVDPVLPGNYVVRPVF